jgi:23S rRNA pseudouridine1911/1915/1917 synthase
MPERTISLRFERGGERLDKAITAALPDLSRAQVQRLIKDAYVTIDGAAAKASYRLEAGDQVTVRIPPPQPTEVVAEAIPLDVVYEDDDLLVINKPAGMVVHPAHGHATGTLVNAVLAHAPELEGVGGEQRPGIVHRLDKNTSGLIVVAKNDRAHRELQRQFKAREVSKAYLALVEGRVTPKQGRIEAPIGRDPAHRQRMAVVRDGREAVTRYTVLETFAEHTLVEAEPVTGRTHQIRLHLAFIGHPIVGDTTYGRRKQRLALDRHFLHARRLTLALPGTGERVTFEPPLPEELEAVLAELRRATGRA